MKVNLCNLRVSSKNNSVLPSLWSNANYTSAFVLIEPLISQCLIYCWYLDEAYSRWSTYLHEADVRTWLDFVISVSVLISQSQRTPGTKRNSESEKMKKRRGYMSTERKASEPQRCWSRFVCLFLFSILINDRKACQTHCWSELCEDVEGSHRWIPGQADSQAIGRLLGQKAASVTKTNAMQRSKSLMAVTAQGCGRFSRRAAAMRLL